MTAMMPRAAFVSFRFGETDGVSVVTHHWRTAFESLGFETVTVAAEGADRSVRGIGIDDEQTGIEPDRVEFEAATADCALVVIENLCTIPLNLSAARMVAGARRGKPTVLHHHDPPWHRKHLEHITELPPQDPSWIHVTINDTTRNEMADRGIESTRIFNGFPAPGSGDRQRLRIELGVSESELLFCHPVRAIERKNIPAALQISEFFGATYWLLGPAEDGYDDELAALLSAATTRVIRGSCPDTDDIYAAADLVLYPSTWEGFGNPPIEAAMRDKGCVVGSFPFAAELASMGFRFLSPDDPEAIQSWLQRPDQATLERNRALAFEHFSLSKITEQIAGLLGRAGWLP